MVLGRLLVSLLHNTRRVRDALISAHPFPRPEILLFSSLALDLNYCPCLAFSLFEASRERTQEPAWR